jgi:hypothetical protein
MTACTRLRTPSFAGTRLTCVLTAPSSIQSEPAISALLNPRASSSRTYSGGVAGSLSPPATRIGGRPMR